MAGRALVTGGVGYVGALAVDELVRAGYEVSSRTRVAAALADGLRFS